MASQWLCNGLALASLMWPSEGTWLRTPYLVSITIRNAWQHFAHDGFSLAVSCSCSLLASSVLAFPQLEREPKHCSLCYLAISPRTHLVIFEFMIHKPCRPQTCARVWPWASVHPLQSSGTPRNPLKKSSPGSGCADLGCLKTIHNTSVFADVFLFLL